jgi:hypothetical protein
MTIIRLYSDWLSIVTPLMYRSRYHIASLLLTCLLALVLASHAWPTTQFAGRVVGIQDGDTIEVLRDGKAVRVRLHGIDTPERRQAFGTKARQFTADLAFKQQVTVLATPSVGLHRQRHATGTTGWHGDLCVRRWLGMWRGGVCSTIFGSSHTLT